MSYTIKKLLAEWSPVAAQSGAYDQYEDYFRASENAKEGRCKEFEYLVSDILKRASSGRIGTWLDIACGDGLMLEVLERQSIQAFGIENDSYLAKKGIDKGRSIFCGGAIEVLTALTERNITFDTVSCFHLIEHLTPSDVETLVALIEKVLSPQGHCVLVTPNASDVRVMLGSFYRDPTHIRPYPLNLIRYLSSKNKLEVIYSANFNKFYEQEKNLLDIESRHSHSIQAINTHAEIKLVKKRFTSKLSS